MQKRSDIIEALVFMVFCVFAWHQILGLPPSDEGDAGMGFFPGFCVVGILIFSAVLLFRSLIFSKMLSGTPPLLTRAMLARLACVLILMLLYSLSYEWLGFYLSTTLFGILFLLFIGERNAFYVVLFPIAITVLVYFGFVRLLGVLLPVGDVFYNLFPSLF